MFWCSSTKTNANERQQEQQERPGSLGSWWRNQSAWEPGRLPAALWRASPTVPRWAWARWRAGRTTAAWVHSMPSHPAAPLTLKTTAAQHLLVSSLRFCLRLVCLKQNHLERTAAQCLCAQSLRKHSKFYWNHSQNVKQDPFRDSNLKIEQTRQPHQLGSTRKLPYWSPMQNTDAHGWYKVQVGEKTRAQWQGKGHGYSHWTSFKKYPTCQGTSVRFNGSIHYQNLCLCIHLHECSSPCTWMIAQWNKWLVITVHACGNVKQMSRRPCVCMCRWSEECSLASL